MHTAAMAPRAIRREDLPEEEVAAAQAAFEAEAEGKPSEIREKIISGKMEQWYRDIVLLDQPFVRDEGRTIGDLINEAIQKFGERIAVERIARFSLR